MKPAPNRLILESSPYLLQHAYNPVDWYPWGEEAFSIAKEKNLPVLVSIGYSACHWCHVMERESFEDSETALLMNQNFINIKVDREELPAVDAIYMEAVQAMTGQGGWPLNCFLTPDGKPFYGGTYFPPVSAHQRPAWKSVLFQLSKLFVEQRDQVEEQAQKLTDHLATDPGFLKIPVEETDNSIPQQQIAKAFLQLSQQWDSQLGGYHRAPKFPSPFVHFFLVGFIENHPQTNAYAQLVLNLNAMSRGGIYDQVGGGFHRYATDPEWLIPHFEKMLYDNVLLSRLYLQAGARFDNAEWMSTGTETLDFLIEEFWDESVGAFYAALDADSEGIEGKYYVWNPTELLQLSKELSLSEVLPEIGWKATGNWEHTQIICRPNGRKTIPQKVEDFLQHLKESRKQKILPQKDTKLLASWNGLALHTFSHAWGITQNPVYKEVMQGLIKFLTDTCTQDGNWFHTYSNNSGPRFIAGIEDYAYILRGLIEAHMHLEDPELIPMTLQLLQVADEQLLDSSDGFYFSAPKGVDQLIVRKKEFYDNAVPSGNAVMTENLWWLGKITENENLVSRAKKNVLKILPVAVTYPSAFGHWLMLAQLMEMDLTEVRLDPKFNKAVYSQFWKMGIPGVWVHGDKNLAGTGKVQICTRNVCHLPLDTIEEGIEFLKNQNPLTTLSLQN